MSELGEVTRLVEILREKMNRAEALSEELKSVNERIRVLTQESIPDAMMELGYQEIRLQDGSRITVKQEVYATINDERRAAALGWLRSNDFGGLIKNEVKVSLGKGDDAIAEEIASFLRSKGVPFEQKEGVHPMTLKSFLREQIEAGAAIPMEAFGAQCVNVAKVSQPEPKKFTLEE